MFVTGCVVFLGQVVITKTRTYRLWCIGLCQGVITKTSQTMSYLH